jgi:hypothetical protein
MCFFTSLGLPEKAPLETGPSSEESAEVAPTPPEIGLACPEQFGSLTVNPIAGLSRTVWEPGPLFSTQTLGPYCL